MKKEDILFIGIAGGTGSGKTTLAEHICNTFGDDIAILTSAKVSYAKEDGK